MAHPPGWLKAPTAVTVFKRSKNARWNLVKATQATPGAVFIKNDKTGRFGSWQKIKTSFFRFLMISKDKPKPETQEGSFQPPVAPMVVTSDANYYHLAAWKVPEALLKD